MAPYNKLQQQVAFLSLAESSWIGLEMEADLFDQLPAPAHLRASGHRARQCAVCFEAAHHEVV